MFERLREALDNFLDAANTSITSGVMSESDWKAYRAKLNAEWEDQKRRSRYLRILQIRKEIMVPIALANSYLEWGSKSKGIREQVKNLLDEAEEIARYKGLSIWEIAGIADTFAEFRPE